MSCYQPGDGPLAQRIDARWAHTLADLTEAIPDHHALFADADAHGCKPIADVRTTLQALAGMVEGEGNPIERRDAAIGAFVADILRYLDRHETLRTVEVWSGAECAMFVHGRGEMMHYATVLGQVHDAIKRERPDVRVLTGGFGCARGATADLTMLEYALAEYAPEKFDVCNMHPLLSSTGYCEVDVDTLRNRLQKARRALDARCAGQPLCATAFGLPTADLPPLPPQYGRYWKRFGGVRIITETQGAQWWLALLEVVRECGLEFCCVMGRDWEPPHVRHQQICGMTRADGSDKAFTGEVVEALQDAL